MAVKIKFDTANNVISPTFILATRNGDKIGNISAVNTIFKDTLNSYGELSFRVYKYYNLESNVIYNLNYDEDDNGTPGIACGWDSSTKTYKVLFWERHKIENINDTIVIPKYYDDGTHGKSLVTIISAGAFQGMSIKNIVIPDSIERIEDYSFQSCTSLLSIFIPNSVKYIGAYAFDNCISLQGVNIGNSVSWIGNRAFRNCSSLSEVNLSTSLESTGGGIFYNCSSLKSITIPKSWKLFGEHSSFEGVFELCTGLENVFISDGVEKIGSNTFYGCSNLKSIVFPSSLRQIYSSAFANCISLKKIYIPKSLISLSSGIFSGCDSITDVYYEGSIEGKKNIFDSISLGSSFLNSTWHYNYIYNNLSLFDIGTNIVECPFWEQIQDFKLLWCRDWDIWFEIYVETDESNEYIKNITAKSLCEAELSQINLYNVEINTEDDIKREDYKAPTTLYNSANHSNSLLHRILNKAPHYSIGTVSSRVSGIQRSFSFDNISVYDALQKISKEINCIFILDSGTDEKGKISRKINVYDLESYCYDCNTRNEFIGSCPKCGSTNVDYGYGIDTSIFISTDNLAESITYSTDTDSVKNCFKLEAGDDLMTATIVNCNPNGSGYIWYIPDEMKDDMSENLVNALSDYDKSYEYYQKEYSIKFSDYSSGTVSGNGSNLCSNYNDLIDKYTKGTIYEYEQVKNLIHITNIINGYSKIMESYYNAIDFEYLLRYSLMPNGITDTPTATTEASKLTIGSISPVSIQGFNDQTSVDTMSNAVLSVARALVDTRFQVKVISSMCVGNVWSGTIRVSKYTDDKDYKDVILSGIIINGDYAGYVQQKLSAAISKSSEDSLDITALFNKDDTNFSNELRRYSLSMLNSIKDACQTCLDLMMEMGFSDKSSEYYNPVNSTSPSYVKYYNKMKRIQSEISVRQNEINIVVGTYDSKGKVIRHGIASILDKEKDTIQDALNFEKFLLEKSSLENNLLNEFSSYRREDTYTNDNYISDGLNNAELFKNALEFIESAKKEIIKSANLQHSITAQLKNLLTIKDFAPITDSFEKGNWLRVRVDDKLYRLRLVEYEIDFDETDNLSVTFSDVKEIYNGYSDVESILNQASSMATTYSSISRQASKGKKGNELLNNWVTKGLSLTQLSIVDTAENQNMVYDTHGLLGREYLPFTDEYSPKQMRIINKGLYLTDDNWESTKVGVGNFIFYDPTIGDYVEDYGVIANTIVGKIILGEKVGIYNTEGSITLDEKGFNLIADTTVTGEYGTKQIFSLQKKIDESGTLEDILTVNDAGEVVLNGSIKISSGNNIAYEDMNSLNEKTFPPGSNLIRNSSFEQSRNISKMILLTSKPNDWGTSNKYLKKLSDGSYGYISSGETWKENYYYKPIFDENFQWNLLDGSHNTCYDFKLDSNKIDGKYSLRKHGVFSTTPTRLETANYINIYGDSNYVFSFFRKFERTGGTAYIYATIKFYSSDNESSLIKSINIGKTLLTSNIDWERISKSFKTPMDANYCKVDLVSEGSLAASGYVYYDCVMLQEGTVASAWKAHPTELSNAMTTIDDSGVSIYNGALRLYNNDGENMITVDDNGNIKFPETMISPVNGSGGWITIGDTELTTLHDTVDYLNSLAIGAETKSQTAFDMSESAWNSLVNLCIDSDCTAINGSCIATGTILTGKLAVGVGKSGTNLIKNSSFEMTDSVYKMNLLKTQPVNWSSNYSNYFIYDGRVYVENTNADWTIGKYYQMLAYPNYSEGYGWVGYIGKNNGKKMLIKSSGGVDDGKYLECGISKGDTTPIYSIETENKITIMPGSNYTVSYYAKKNTNSEMAYEHYVQFIFYDNNGNSLTISDIIEIENDSGLVIGTPNNLLQTTKSNFSTEWTRYFGTFKIKNNSKVAYCIMRLRLSKSGYQASDSQICFDHIMLEESAMLNSWKGHQSEYNNTYVFADENGLTVKDGKFTILNKNNKKVVEADENGDLVIGGSFKSGDGFSEIYMSTFSETDTSSGSGSISGLYFSNSGSEYDYDDISSWKDVNSEICEIRAYDKDGTLISGTFNILSKYDINFASDSSIGMRGNSLEFDFGSTTELKSCLRLYVSEENTTAFKLENYIGGKSEIGLLFGREGYANRPLLNFKHGTSSGDLWMDSSGNLWWNDKKVQLA